MSDYKNVMLISPNTIKAYGVLNLNVDDSVLGNCIRISQNIYLKDIIGEDIIEHLQELVYNKINGKEDTIDDDSNIAYKTLLDEYIKPVLVYRSVVEAAIVLTLKIRNAGLIKNSDTNVNITSTDDIFTMRDYYETYFYDAVNSMIGFLCENKGAFVEIEDGFCSCASRPLYARTNLWLGK